MVEDLLYVCLSFVACLDNWVLAFIHIGVGLMLPLLVWSSHCGERHGRLVRNSHH